MSERTEELQDKIEELDDADDIMMSIMEVFTQTVKEVAGSYYNSALEEIDYAKIYNLEFGSNFIGKLGASDEWMGKALTDKTYKEVFKKATGKNSLLMPVINIFLVI